MTDEVFDPKMKPWLRSVQERNGTATQAMGADGFYTQPHGYLRGVAPALPAEDDDRDRTGR